MDSLTIRVSRSTHGLLRELANRLGESMTDIVDRSVREFEKQQFWADYNAAYATLQADPAAWAEFEDEIALWDTTLSDGLENESDEVGESSKLPVSG